MMAVLASVRRDLRTELLYDGTAMLARIAIITTTTISSMSVKACGT